MDREPDGFPGKVSAANPLAMVTISCGLGDRRTMQMAINISAADDLDVQNAMLDQAMGLMDRQQARYDLEELEKNFTQVGLTTRNLIAAMSGADIEVKTRVERLKAELAGKEEGRKAIHDEAYGAHVSSGRRGEFKPAGLVQQRLNAADIEIQKTKDAIEAAPADAAQHRATLIQNVLRHQEDIRIRRLKINDLRALAGLPLNREYEDAENAKV